MPPSQIIVTAAIITHNHRVLIARRRDHPDDLQPGLWEFPGGKVQFGEHPEASLKREIREELELEISDLRLAYVVSDLLGTDDESIHAVMLAYTCGSETDRVHLNYHEEVRWVNPQDFPEYEFAKLDVPIIKALTEGSANNQ